MNPDGSIRVAHFSDLHYGPKNLADRRYFRQAENDRSDPAPGRRNHGHGCSATTSSAALRSGSGGIFAPFSRTSRDAAPTGRPEPW